MEIVFLGRHPTHFHGNQVYIPIEVRRVLKGMVGVRHYAAPYADHDIQGVLWVPVHELDGSKRAVTIDEPPSLDAELQGGQAVDLQGSFLHLGPELKSRLRGRSGTLVGLGYGMIIIDAEQAQNDRSDFSMYGRKEKV